MEKEIFDELPEFDRLVAGSRFEALAADEQAVVVKYMTPGEFNEMHELAVAEKEETLRLRNAIGPLADVREKLLACLAAGSPPVASERTGEGPSAGTFSRESEWNMAGSREGSRAAGPAGSPVAYWHTRRVPLYQAAIAASLLIILLLAFMLPARFNASRLAVTDTVYLEKTVRITDTVWLTDDRDDGSPGHSVSGQEPARQPQGSAAGYRKDDAHHPGTPGVDARRQGADGLARTTPPFKNRKGDTDQPGTSGTDARRQGADGLARTTAPFKDRKGDAVQTSPPGDYARRQMADALARIAPLASGRPGNSFPVDADLIRLVAVQY